MSSFRYKNLFPSRKIRYRITCLLPFVAAIITGLAGWKIGGPLLGTAVYLFLTGAWLHRQEEEAWKTYPHAELMMLMLQICVSLPTSALMLWLLLGGRPSTDGGFWTGMMMFIGFFLLYLVSSSLLPFAARSRRDADGLTVETRHEEVQA